MKPFPWLLFSQRPAHNHHLREADTVTEAREACEQPERTAPWSAKACKLWSGLGEGEA